MISEKLLGIEPLGSFRVRIDHLRPHERYPNELFRVLWSVLSPEGRVVRTEFTLKFSDQLFQTFGIKCYRDTEENEIENKQKVSDILLSHLYSNTTTDDGKTQVQLYFAEGQKSHFHLSGYVVWSQSGDYFAT